MTPQTNAYDELASPAQMQSDCRATGRHLRLEEAVRRVGHPAPSLHFDEQPRERAKPQIEVSAAAARLAGALHFHLE